MRPHAGVAGRLPPALAVGGGVVLALLALLWGGAQGAYAISPLQILVVLRDALGGHAAQGPEHLVFLNIRLPRLLLGAAAGAGLGVAGALMQGLFRNPLADPGLIGVSSGAALAAAGGGGALARPAPARRTSQARRRRVSLHLPAGAPTLAD